MTFRSIFFFTPAWMAIPALMLAACVPLAERAPEADAAQCPPPPELALSASQVVRYHACLASLPPADAAREYDAVTQQFARTGGNSDRLKLALALALPDTPFHNTQSALKLVNGYPETHGASRSGLRELAGMLAMLLAAQQHSEDAANDLRKALAGEKARSAQLQSKIDEVKELESKLNQRYQP